MSLFIVFGILMIMLAAAIVVTPLLRMANGENAPVTATILALAVPACVVLLYVSVGNFDWSAEVPQDSTSVPTSAPNGDVPDMAAAIASLEERLRREPDDLEGWLLLGRANVQLQQYPAARQAYLTAVQLDTGTEARLGLAETDILLDRTSLTGDAGVLIEEILAVEPDNPALIRRDRHHAIVDDDPEAYYHADNLLTWLDRGGFAPGGGKLRLTSIRSFCTWVKTAYPSED